MNNHEIIKKIKMIAHDHFCIFLDKTSQDLKDDPNSAINCLYIATVLNELLVEILESEDE